jgi:hypothetical protein
MLPIIDGINDVLSPIVDKFMKGDFKGDVKLVKVLVTLYSCKTSFDAMVIL